MSAEIDAANPDGAQATPTYADNNDDLMSDFAAEAPGEAKYRTLEQMSKVGGGTVSVRC